MILSELSKSGQQVLVVYPGRFQPFHKGHKAVYDYLTSKYDNVYVATSDKVEPPRSPFSFEEKKKMMELTGMDTSKVVQVKNPYNPMEIAQNFDKEKTILLIAVSEKDMAEDPRFSFKPKKDGSPSYFQNAKNGNLQTMDKHGYILTVPTFNFDVLGKPMKSATEVRSAFSKMDTKTKKRLIQDLFGNYSDEVFALMTDKVLESIMESVISEGGWMDTITQQTTLTPKVVKSALKVVKDFTDRFNIYLTDRGQQPVEMGNPTGSSAYYKVDEPDMEYGDIDLQMIAVDDPEKTPTQIASHYNKLMNDFIAQTNLGYMYDSGKPANGQPIFTLPSGEHVQVDMLWAPKKVADFHRWRVTPQRGVKGLITGNLYGVLGEIMYMSLQHAAYMKIKDGQPVNYQKSRKVDKVIEVTSNIGKFGVEILKHVYKAVNGNLKGLVINDTLQQHPGLNKKDVQIKELVTTIKALAQAFEDNDLYGKWNLRDHANKEEFLQAFMAKFVEKADARANAAKLDKASTPEEVAKRDELRAKIAKGVNIVKQAFEGNIEETAQHGTDKNRVFGGLDGDIIAASKALEELFAKVKEAPQGTKVRQRFLIKLHNAMNKLKQQMEINLELRENYGLDKLQCPDVLTLRRKQETYNLSLSESNGSVKIKVLETNKTLPLSVLTKLYERGYRKVEENKKMSAQKIGVFAKGKTKVSLWEHDGTVVLVDQKSQRLQESKGSVKETVNTLYDKGYVCESVDMITMKNAAGAMMRVMYDKIKGTTTVRDEQGGSHTYQAAGDKVVNALAKKGFKKLSGDEEMGGLSLVPKDEDLKKGWI